MMNLPAVLNPLIFLTFSRNTINGYAIQSTTEPAELSVHFFSSPAGAPCEAFLFVVQRRLIPLHRLDHPAGPAAVRERRRVRAVLRVRHCERCINYHAIWLLIVQDPTGVSLFVLARDPATYTQFYNTSVFHTLDVLGFTKDYNRPVVRNVQAPCCAFKTCAAPLPGQRLRVPAAAALTAI